MTEQKSIFMTIKNVHSSVGIYNTKNKNNNKTYKQ